MSISAVCPGCQKTYRAPESAAGKTVLCKKCGNKFKVPAAPDDDDALLDELIDEPQGEDEAEDEPSIDIFGSAPAPRRASRSGSAPAGARPRTAARRTGLSGTQKWLAGIAAVVGLVLLVCGGGVYYLMSLTKLPPASAQASEPFPVETLKIPAFPELPAPQTVPQSNVALYHVDLGTANPASTQPAARTRLRVYVPTGEHAEHSLGCVLVGPAGTNLLTGNDLDDPNYHDETLPYALAGYVAVTCSLDGPLPPGADGSNTRDLATAYRGFSGAYAGLANARAALEFVLARLPQVDPARIFAAGHSSAGTLALLFAEHEPRLKGCVAYAPCTDVGSHLGMMLRLLAASNDFPGIVDFAKRSSPSTHLSRIKCPLFLFWADDDQVVAPSELQRFAAEIGNLRPDVTSRTVASGGHFEAMIDPGIPQAIQWLRGLPGESLSTQPADASH
jgi:dienelactone hydrolase